MYSANYLAEEIKAEAAARNIQGFARFLNVCAVRSGQIIDYSKIATFLNLWVFDFFKPQEIIEFANGLVAITAVAH